jgi:hypothetical protein
MVWLVGLVLVPALGFGQPQQAPQQAPPRDASPTRDTSQKAQTGTATIRGHVVAADTGQPLRKAQVRIMAPELRENRLTSTDAEGKYEFKEVLPGRYNVMASKGSYVQLQYGQQRPFEPGKPLEILDRQLVEKVDFALPRGAIITGRVLDEFGEPLPDAMVMAQRYQNINGQRRLVPAGRTGTTNDIGEYRLFAIPPGQYYLSATLRSFNGPLTDSDDRSGYAPTYFPGTANIAESQKVTVTLGQQISDMNMALMPSRMSRITGMAQDAQGQPMVGMVMAIPRGETTVMMMGQPGQIKPDGSFVIGGVAPGRYMLLVRGGSASIDAAFTEVSVSGDDLDGVKLTARPPSHVTGRIVVDPAAAQTLRSSTLRLTMMPTQMDMMSFAGAPPAAVQDDLTFDLRAYPGQARLQFAGSPPGWSIRSVRHRGVDVIDTGFDVKVGEDVNDVDVEITNRVTNVSGMVTNGKGDPQKDYSVVVFAQDRDKWTPMSRYMRTARPDQDGRYKVIGLPPGEYRVIALDYIDQNEWNTPEFLDGIRNKATAFTVEEGETKSVDLKLLSTS